MAIPSGSGTEVLYRTTINAQATDITAFRWDRTNATTGTDTYTVPANHIITVLTVYICNTEATARTVKFWVNDGTNVIRMLFDQSIGEKETFVMNDRIVLVAGDALLLEASGGNIDAHCSFIDQDWS